MKYRTRESFAYYKHVTRIAIHRIAERLLEWKSIEMQGHALRFN